MHPFILLSGSPPSDPFRSLKKATRFNMSARETPVLGSSSMAVCLLVSGFNNSPGSGARDPRLDPADAGEVRNGDVARLQRELAHERAGHDDVARLQLPPVLAELFGEPLNRIQRIAEHGRAEAR